jgi:hypothetical protein
LQLVFSTDGVGQTSSVGTTTPIPTNQWVFVQLGRSGSVLKMSFDGVIVATNVISGTCFSGTADLLIGALNPSNGLPFNGYIDDFRIRTEAPSLVDFTPPSSPFTY